MNPEVREQRYSPLVLAVDGTEIGYYERSTRPPPSWLWRLLRRIRLVSITLFSTLLIILIIVSVVSLFIAFYDVKDDLSLQETAPEPFSLRSAELRPGWHLFNLSWPSDRILNYKERPTLTESFFSLECAEAWIARGTLCDEMMHRTISHDLQNSMKISTVHTWVNGSDAQFSLWKQTIIENDFGITPDSRKRPVGNVARHFRYCSSPLALSHSHLL